MLVGHRVADVVVLLCNGFDLEMVRNISILLSERLSSMSGVEKEGKSLEIIYQPYGFDLEHHDVCVRVAFATKDPSEIGLVGTDNVSKSLAHLLQSSFMFSCLPKNVLYWTVLFKLLYISEIT